MQGKVTLEDHMATEATLGDSKVFGEHVWDKLGPRLTDVQDMRLREMDKGGVFYGAPVLAKIQHPSCPPIPICKSPS